MRHCDCSHKSISVFEDLNRIRFKFIFINNNYKSQIIRLLLEAPIKKIRKKTIELTLKRPFVQFEVQVLNLATDVRLSNSADEVYQNLDSSKKRKKEKGK